MRCNNQRSLDHLVGSRKQRRWHGDAEPPGYERQERASRGPLANGGLLGNRRAVDRPLGSDGSLGEILCAIRLEQLSQLAEQRPCLQEVRGFKALSKPAVDRREHVECSLTFALLSTKAGAGDAGAQFKRLRTLPELWERVQAVLDGRNVTKAKRGKHNFAFAGLIACAKCGCSVVGEVKKQRYVYYHCTGYADKCQSNPAYCRRKYAREEVLKQRFTELLGLLRFDDEVLEWVGESIHASHESIRRQQLRCAIRVKILRPSEAGLTHEPSPAALVRTAGCPAGAP